MRIGLCTSSMLWAIKKKTNAKKVGVAMTKKLSGRGIKEIENGISRD